MAKKRIESEKTPSPRASAASRKQSAHVAPKAASRPRRSGVTAKQGGPAADEPPTMSKRSMTSKGAQSVSPALVARLRRQRMIAEAAYFLAERRGFASGSELDDWLEAESLVDAGVAQSGH